MVELEGTRWIARAVKCHVGRRAAELWNEREASLSWGACAGMRLDTLVRRHVSAACEWGGVLFVGTLVSTPPEHRRLQTYMYVGG